VIMRASFFAVLLNSNGHAADDELGNAILPLSLHFILAAPGIGHAYPIAFASCHSFTSSGVSRCCPAQVCTWSRESNETTLS
jgi:hypothetical protein